MKWNISNIRFFKVLLIVVIFNPGLFSMAMHSDTQNDTVFINEISVPPVIDGIGNDVCWLSSDWNSINNVWIPWGTYVDSSDYFGRYKAVWSSEHNLIYFLVEINDDIISDGYIPGQSSEIYNFDMIEVFIDENKSGGYHVFDGMADDEVSLGTNAENAFAYHIFAKIPESGESGSDFRSEDIAGTDWAHFVSAVNNSHFPDFIIRRSGNVTTREFSLMVFNDTYSESNIEGSMVTLIKDKIIGLTLAFNDDDQPEISVQNTTRDNFFGSVSVSEPAYNDHWKNANDFGIAILKSHLNTGINDRLKNSEIQIFPNPVYDEIIVQLINKSNGPVDLSLFNGSGQKIISLYNQKDEDLNRLVIPAEKLFPGVYFLKICTESCFMTKKVIVSGKKI